MNLHLPPSQPNLKSSSAALRRGWRRLQDHLMINVYGGVSREDIARYADQPDTLAGLIAMRTGRPRQKVRAWLNTALAQWHRA